MTAPTSTLAEAAWRAHHDARAPHTVALSWEDLQESAPATAAAWESAAATIRAQVLADVLVALPDLATPLPYMLPRARLESLLKRMADGTPVPLPLALGTGGHTVRNVLTGERFHACALEWLYERNPLPAGRDAPRSAPISHATMKEHGLSWNRCGQHPRELGALPWARDASGHWVPVVVLP